MNEIFKPKKVSKLMRSNYDLNDARHKSRSGFHEVWSLLIFGTQR